jgi:hypothetical protein
MSSRSHADLARTGTQQPRGQRGRPGGWALRAAVRCALAVVLLFGVMTGTAGAATSAPAAPQAVPSLRVTAYDDYYRLGTTQVASGPVTVTLRNAGAMPHQAEIGRFKPGATVEQFAAAVKARQLPRALGLIAGFYGGPAPVGPRGTQTTYQGLPAGNYLVLCFVTDEKTHQPHFAMGMYAGFRVTGPDRSGQARQQSATVAAVDPLRFAVPASVRTNSVVRFDNRSAGAVHEFAIGRLHRGKTLADVRTWARNGGPSPYDELGGAGAVNPGGREWFTLGLRPGTYIAVCLVPDARGVAHAASGMVTTFTVTR